MKLSSLLNGPVTAFYLVIVKLKLIWYFRTMSKRKKAVINYLSDRFSKEKGFSRKFREKLISNYLDVGNALLDRKLYKKVLMSQVNIPE